MNKYCNKGFTLIELLVVMSIFTLISSLIMYYVTLSKAKARDAIRKNNLNAIADALEMYYDENNTYPTFSSTKNLENVVIKNNKYSFRLINVAQAVGPLPAPGLSSCSITNNKPSYCTGTYPSSIGNYLKQVPMDPINNSYFFIV